MRRRSALPAIVALAVLAAGCSRPTEQARTRETPTQLPAAAAPSDPAMVASVAKGNREFGLALYRQVATKPGNVFISPISIAGAFGPVIAGAEGETRTAIAGALRFPGNGNGELHPALGGLLRGLEREQDGVTLSIANALWLQQGFAIKPAFARTARTDYEALSETVDFVSAPVAAAARINAWVDSETRGRIPTLFAPEAFTVDTRLVVTNAVYFLGDWAEPFRRSATQPQPFFVPGGTTRQVPLMFRRGQYRTIETSEFQAIDLPYKDGRLSMTVFLPQARDGLPAFEAGLTPQRLDGWLEELDAARTNKTELHLPRLQIAETYDLVKPLSAMGMGIAFSPLQAGFGGITDKERLYISAVAHKTFVRMDEKGTEAAAATGVVGEAVSAPLLFRADHPFFFVLRDKRSGTILFMGRIVEPGPA